MAIPPDRIKVNGKFSTAVALTALIVGGGGTYYATQGEHRYTQAEADRDIAALQEEMRNVRQELAKIEAEVSLFAVQGPSEVRRALERLEAKIDAIER